MFIAHFDGLRKFLFTGRKVVEELFTGKVMVLIEEARAEKCGNIDADGPLVH